MQKIQQENECSVWKRKGNDGIENTVEEKRMKNSKNILFFDKCCSFYDVWRSDIFLGNKCNHVTFPQVNLAVKWLWYCWCWCFSRKAGLWLYILVQVAEGRKTADGRGGGGGGGGDYSFYPCNTSGWLCNPIYPQQQQQQQQHVVAVAKLIICTLIYIYIPGIMSYLRQMQSFSQL